jgi:iron-sulfur cluster insertion protein
MDTQMVDAPFRLSERAAAQINAIVQSQPPGGPDKLRVAVLAGGCSGFQYRFELDATRAEDDLVVERDGAVVLVDPASLDLLAGSELDYSDALMGAHFTVRNPNAASACGCGTSFSVE